MFFDLVFYLITFLVYGKNLNCRLLYNFQNKDLAYILYILKNINSYLELDVFFFNFRNYQTIFQ